MSQQRRMTELMQTYGVPTDVHRTMATEDVLQSEVYRTLAHVEWLADVVRAMDPQALVWGPAEREVRDVVGESAVGFSYVQATETAAVSQWLELYQRERTQLVTVCKTALQCNVAERQVRIAERQAEIITRVLKAVLNDPALALSDAQQQHAAQRVSEQLRIAAPK